VAIQQPTPTPPQQTDGLPLAWRQGEHVAVVGDTGTGKTFLLSRIVPFRSHVVILKTKRDDTWKEFRSFRRVKDARAMSDHYADKLIVDPPYEKQAEVGYDVLERAWKMGGWTVVIDELWYTERLGLRGQVERLLTQGRSEGLTAIVGMQRPVFVSRFALSQCTHVFSFRVEGRDVKVMRDAFSDLLVPYISVEQRYASTAVRGHDFAYFQRPRRIVTTGNAKRIDRIFIPPNGDR
jgi:DNA helicase HerA-like ATPase